MVDGGQLGQLFLRVTVVQAVLDDVGPHGKAEDLGCPPALLGSIDEVGKTDEIVIAYGVGGYLLDALDSFVETLPLTDVWIDGKHHLVAVGRLTPLGA